jgi:hypothetical protein
MPPAWRFSFYRRCDLPARDRRRYRHQARQSQLASARPGLRPISRTAAANMCADNTAAICLSARGLAGLSLGAGELSPMLAQGSNRPCKPVAGTPRLHAPDHAREERGKGCALTPVSRCRSGAGNRRRSRTDTVRSSPWATAIARDAAFPCVDPVETADDKLSALAWRVPARDRTRADDDPTIIRHLHDLAAAAADVGREGSGPRLSILSSPDEEGSPGDASPPLVPRARVDGKAPKLRTEERIFRLRVVEITLHPLWRHY